MMQVLAPQHVKKRAYKIIEFPDFFLIVVAGHRRGTPPHPQSITGGAQYYFRRPAPDKCLIDPLAGGILSAWR
jgi:hypothetical protein